MSHRLKKRAKMDINPIIKDKAHLESVLLEYGTKVINSPALIKFIISHFLYESTTFYQEDKYFNFGKGFIEVMKEEFAISNIGELGYGDFDTKISGGSFGRVYRMTHNSNIIVKIACSMGSGKYFKIDDLEDHDPHPVMEIALEIINYVLWKSLMMFAVQNGSADISNIMCQIYRPFILINDKSENKYCLGFVAEKLHKDIGKLMTIEKVEKNNDPIMFLSAIRLINSLTALQRYGITFTHRDMSPRNIMVQNKRYKKSPLKIIDYGWCQTIIKFSAGETDLVIGRSYFLRYNNVKFSEYDMFLFLLHMYIFRKRYMRLISKGINYKQIICNAIDEITIKSHINSDSNSEEIWEYPYSEHIDIDNFNQEMAKIVNNIK